MSVYLTEIFTFQRCFKRRLNPPLEGGFNELGDVLPDFDAGGRINAFSRKMSVKLRNRASGVRLLPNCIYRPKMPPKQIKFKFRVEISSCFKQYCSPVFLDKRTLSLYSFQVIFLQCYFKTF